MRPYMYVKEQSDAAWKYFNEKVAGKTSEYGNFTNADWNHVVDLRDEIVRLRDELAAAKLPSLCSVCVGQPLKSGRECICDGKGTEQAEMHGLRVRCFDLEAELDQIKDTLDRISNTIERL